jgi:hypothetical protein
MTLIVRYTHLAFPTFEFSVEIYDDYAYRCAIILEMDARYDRSNGCEIERFENDVDDAHELSLVKEDLLQVITPRSIRDSLHDTLCETFSDQIYDQIMAKLL